MNIGLICITLELHAIHTHIPLPPDSVLFSVGTTGLSKGASSLKPLNPFSVKGLEGLPVAGGRVYGKSFSNVIHPPMQHTPQ